MPSHSKKKKPAPVEYPENSGIRIYEARNQTGGKVYGIRYRVVVPAKLTGIPNKPESWQRQTLAAAKTLAEDRFLALKKHGTEFAAVPASAQRQLATAWSILSEHNEKAAESLRLNIVDVVKAGIRSLRPTGGRKTVAEVFAELRDSKKGRHEARGLDESTIHDFTTRSGRIERDFGSRVISEVSHTEVADWLKKMAEEGGQFGRPLSPRSIKNYKDTLSACFRHAVSRQYCAENPFDRFSNEDRKTLFGDNHARGGRYDRERALTVPEAQRLLRAAQESNEPGMLASVVLRLFCGLRTSETCLLAWEDVRWLDEKPFVFLSPEKTKTRQVRDVEIPANALAWLKLCNPPASGRIIQPVGTERKNEKAYCARFRRIVKSANVGVEVGEDGGETKWERNGTRNSFGSYHYALHGDAVRTTAQMGNTPKMLFTYYRKWASNQDAKAYFAIVPDVGAEKVTQFPQAATA